MSHKASNNHLSQVFFFLPFLVQDRRADKTRVDAQIKKHFGGQKTNCESPVTQRVVKNIENTVFLKTTQERQLVLGGGKKKEEMKEGAREEPVNGGGLGDKS